MAIQYPDFRADPNAVPNAGGWSNIISNAQKGYMLSQLPAQMKMQKALQQAQLQKSQQEAYYYPQQQESQLRLQGAQTQGAELQNQYYPQLTQAQLDQSAAQTGLLGQQSAMYKPLTQSQIALNQAQAAKAGQGDNGITIGTDENGKPIIQIGGSGGGASSRNGGRLGTDDKGNITSELTQGNKTAIQNRKIGEDVVEPFINQIVDNLPQFQTETKKAQSAVSGAANRVGLAGFIDKNPLTQKLGLSSTLPSQKATGEAAVITSTDGLIKALGLRPTDQQTAGIQKIMAPRAGESAEGYKTRVKAFWSTLQNNTSNAQKMLATGINTGVNLNGPQAQPQQAPAPNPALSHLTDEQLAQIANGGQ